MGAKSEIFSRRLPGNVYLFTDEGRTTGSIFFVHSGSGTNSATGGTNPDRPLASIDYAVGLCTANKGDRIYVMPGHAETLAGAGGITADIAGISIIGLGNGSNRPTITLGHTAATIAVSADNVLFRNLRITSSVDEVVKCFDVTGKHCVIDGVDYFETATFQLIQFLLTTAAADGITVRNCRHHQGTAGTATQKWLQLVGVDDCLIEDNTFHLTLDNNATAVTISGSTALVRGVIRRNTIVQLGGTTQVSGILLVDGSTTFVHDNRVAVGSTALAGIVDVGNAGYAAENYALNTPDKSGILDPGVDS